MEDRKYTLTRVEGEYAYLSPDDGGEELFIAMALLPVGVDVGDRLLYSFPDFSLI